MHWFHKYKLNWKILQKDSKYIIVIYGQCSCGRTREYYEVMCSDNPNWVMVNKLDK